MNKYNKYIDHTYLKPQGQKGDIENLCREAREHDFASVCVNPYWVGLCANLLKGTDVKVCTVIGFPLGATSTQSKALEVRQAVLDGAEELDMVINVGALKDRDLDAVTEDIKAVVEAAEGRCVKVIIETCLLTNEEKILACQAATRAKATFVKTSTGFSTGGATVEDVRLMKESIAADMQVKASGGVRTMNDMLAMIEAGATRIGTSSGVLLMQGEAAQDSY